MATAETTGKGTNEYRAIERHYDALVDTLGKTVDPANSARKLGEESLISDGEFCNNKYKRDLSRKSSHNSAARHKKGRDLRAK